MFGFLKRKSDPNSFFSHYSLLEKLGEGGYGTVFVCRQKNGGTLQAVKIVIDKKYKRKTWCDRRQMNMPDEILLWERAAHHSVVQLCDLYVEQDLWLSVMEYDPKYIDLSKLLSKRGPMTSEASCDIIRQVVEVCKYLRSIGVDHRDIKCENLLYNPQTGHIKLIDFGSASPLHTSPYTRFQGTEGCIPPEFYLKGSYSSGGSAVWSVGCLAYTLLKVSPPFSNQEEVVSGKMVMWEYSEDCQARHFVEQCLVYNVSHRIRFDSLSKHPWLTKSAP